MKNYLLLIILIFLSTEVSGASTKSALLNAELTEVRTDNSNFLAEQSDAADAAAEEKTTVLEETAEANQTADVLGSKTVEDAIEPEKRTILDSENGVHQNRNAPLGLMNNEENGNVPDDISLGKRALEINQSEHSGRGVFQDNLWHISAITVAVLSGLMVSLESQAYNDLAGKNKNAESQLESAVLIQQVNLIRAEFIKNKAEMSAHKDKANNYLYLVSLALAWEGYLLLFTSNNNEPVDEEESRFKPKINMEIQPVFGSPSLALTLSVMWD